VIFVEPASDLSLGLLVALPSPSLPAVSGSGVPVLPHPIPVSPAAASATASAALLASPGVFVTVFVTVVTMVVNLVMMAVSSLLRGRGRFRAQLGNDRRRGHGGGHITGLGLDLRRQRVLRRLHLVQLPFTEARPLVVPGLLRGGGQALLEAVDGLQLDRLGLVLEGVAVDLARL